MKEVTYKPTLGWIFNLPTIEGSLKHVKNENTKKYLAMSTQRLDSAIEQVFFSLKGLVGQTRGRKHWVMGSNPEIYYEY
jgi:hypothetical protein